MSDPVQELFGVPTAELFASRALVVRHAERDELPAFLRSGLLESIDSLVRGYSGGLEVANGSAAEGVQVPIADVPPLALLKLGLTVVFKDLRRQLAPAREWLKRLERSLGVPECADISAFANSAGSGLSLHHDRFDQFLFHLAGEKQFRYAPNRFVRNPDLPFSTFGPALPEFGQVYRRGFPSASEELIGELQSVTLKPGSFLFMPAGTWHTTAEQSGPCLSVVVVVRAPSRLALLGNWLQYYAGQSEDWRARTYGAWGDDPLAREREERRFGELLVELGQRLQSASTRLPFDAWRLHAFTMGTNSEYPLGASFERYVRLPSSSIRLEPDAALDKLRCVVRSGPTHRPQAETVLAFNPEARPVIDWIMATRAAFTVTDLVERFPEFTRVDLVTLLAWLSHAALLRPIPAEEWAEVLASDAALG